MNCNTSLSQQSKIAITLTLLSAFLFSSSANSADSDGKFAALGAGVATCERYVVARNEQSDEFFLFGGWIDGYISARNQLDPDTYTLAPWQTIDILAGFITDYCKKNPKQAFMRAVMVMAEALKAQRLGKSSKRITVSAGTKSKDFFVATIIRIHDELKKREYYQGDSSGKFDIKTLDAIKSFQLKHNIVASGFPDQTTLFKLFN